MKALTQFAMAILVVLSLACDNNTAQQGQLISMVSPATGNSELPRLFTSDKGEIYISWVEKKEKQSQLFYAKLDDKNNWGKSTLIAEGDNWFVNWADFPSFIANDDFMVAHWLQKSANGTYDYDIRMSTSNDGLEWSESFIPHNDGVSAEHGFVSMIPLNQNEYFATWLDGRNTKGGHGDHSGAMTVRGGIFSSEGEAKNEWELDNRTCDCCQTDAVMTPDGPVVVYRDRSENEIRDIFITKYKDENWTTPQPVANDLWEIAGCPVNGPSVATSENQLAVAWFTAAHQVTKVQLALSKDWGDSFSSPIIVAEGNTQGRVGLTALANNTFVVSWLKTEGESSSIMLSNYDTQGALLKQIEVKKTSSARASGFPVITSNQNQLFIAWTNALESSQIESAYVNF